MTLKRGGRRKTGASCYPYANDPRKECYTLDEACAILNYSRDRLTAAIRKKKFPAIFDGGVYRIPIKTFREAYHLPPISMN